MIIYKIIICRSSISNNGVRLFCIFKTTPSTINILAKRAEAQPPTTPNRLHDLTLQHLQSFPSPRSFYRWRTPCLHYCAPSDQSKWSIIDSIIGTIPPCVSSIIALCASTVLFMNCAYDRLPYSSHHTIYIIPAFHYPYLFLVPSSQSLYTV